jgi:hypothetical protein
MRLQLMDEKQPWLYLQGPCIHLLPSYLNSPLIKHSFLVQKLVFLSSHLSSQYHAWMLSGGL